MTKHWRNTTSFASSVSRDFAHALGQSKKILGSTQRPLGKHKLLTNCNEELGTAGETIEAVVTLHLALRSENKKKSG